MSPFRWDWRKLERKALRVAAWSAISLFCAVMALSIVLPIYTDEVLWRILLAGYFKDGHTLLNLNVVCRSEFAIPVPWSWYPWRVLDAWIYGKSVTPLYIRVLGIAGFLAWLCAFAAIVFRSSRVEQDRVFSASIIVSCLGLGVFPFLFVINRPEQVLILGEMILVLLVLQRRLKPAMSLVAFVIVVSMMFAAHPKAIFFMPFVLVVGYELFRARRLRWAAWGTTLLLALSSMQYSAVRTGCREDVFIEQIRAGAGVLKIGNLLVNPGAFFRKAFQNFMDYPSYLASALFQADAPHSWLHLSPEDPLVFTLRDAINIGINLVFYITIAYVLVAFLLLLPKSREVRSRCLRSLVLPASLLGSVLFMTVFQGAKLFYEASLFYISVLTGLFLLWRDNLLPYGTTMAKWLTRSLLVLAIASMSYLLLSFGPIARLSWIGSGYVRGQQYLISVTGFESQSRIIKETARKCGIPEAGRLDHLITDDLTYLVCRDQTYRPINALFVSQLHLVYMTDLFEIGRYYGSAGLISHCRNLDKQVRKLATRNGDYCCFGSEVFRRSTPDK